MFYESEDDFGIKSETSQNNILLVLCCLYDKINFFELSTLLFTLKWSAGKVLQFKNALVILKKDSICC